jgi:RimJ/RimL family protein N-acetyltransferase
MMTTRRFSPTSGDREVILSPRRAGAGQHGLVIETDRLVLRTWEPDDIDELEGIFAQPAVWQYPFGRGWTRDETQAFLDRKRREWATRGWSQWAVEHRADRRLIGFLGLQPPEFLPEVMPTVEIGWRLEPAYWGQGLATEGGRAGLRFGFEQLDLAEIVSIYEPANVASGRVMEKLGMHHYRDTVHPTLGLALRVLRLTQGEWRSAVAP